MHFAILAAPVTSRQQGGVLGLAWRHGITRARPVRWCEQPLHSRLTLSKPSLSRPNFAATSSPPHPRRPDLEPTPHPSDLIRSASAKKRGFVLNNSLQRAVAAAAQSSARAKSAGPDPNRGTPNPPSPISRDLSQRQAPSPLAPRPAPLPTTSPPRFPRRILHLAKPKPPDKPSPPRLIARPPRLTAPRSP